MAKIEDFINCHLSFPETLNH